MFTKPARLLIFYALAMQCMSMLAVVRRKTGSWKWPVFRFLFMSGLLTRGAGWRTRRGAELGYFNRQVAIQ